MAGDSQAQAPAPAAAAEPGGDDHRSSEPLRAERRKSNQLEKEIRTLRQQLNRFSEINPEEYARLQEAERQKQILEQQMELRERQMEEASAQKVAAVAAERDEAKQQILQLRKDRLLERAFSQAEGRTGGDARGTFFDIFKGQLGTCFRLTTGGEGKDVLGVKRHPLLVLQFSLSPDTRTAGLPGQAAAGRRRPADDDDRVPRSDAHAPRLRLPVPAAGPGPGCRPLAG
jgi:hypothetical protein